MKYANRVSEAQQKLIRELRDGTMTLEKLKETEQANARRMSRWYRNRFFWMNVQRAMRESEKRALVENHLIVREADEHLRTGVRDKVNGLGPNHLATIKLAKEQWRADRRLEISRRRRAKKKAVVDAERDLVHPNFKHREAELLAVLERDREESTGC